MKRKILVMAFLTLLFVGTLSLSALEEQAGGKNLMNPDDFHVVGDMLKNSEALNAKKDTYYTLTVPSYDYLEDAHLTVRDENSMPYVSVNLMDGNSASCETVYSESLFTCTFKVHASSQGLHITLEGGRVAQYLAMYGFENFQLEEGNVRTPYRAFEAQNTSVPEISGSGTLVLSYEENRSIESIIAAYFQAYDEIDGDLSEAIVASVDEYTGNETVVGVYYVELSVSDSASNTATFDLTIVVEDLVAPVIELLAPIRVNVNDETSLEALIEEYFSFYDAYDGVIETYTVSSDEYSHNKSVLGHHAFTLWIEDSSHNVTSFETTVEVYDIDAPFITGPSEIELYLSQPFGLEAVLAMYQFTDNHTETSAIETTLEFDESPDVLTEVGSYLLYVFARDESLNEAYVEVMLHVIDDVAPVVSGPAVYTLSYQDTLDVALLKSMLDVSDNHDTLNVEHVSVSENTHMNVPGQYVITFIVEDLSGNQAFHSIFLHVIDDVPPYFIVDDVIMIDAYQALSEQTLFNALKHHQGLKGLNFDSMRILESEYSEHHGPGEYAVILELRNEGELEIIEVMVHAREIEAVSEGLDFARVASAVGFFMIVSSYLVMVKLKKS